MPPPLKGIPQQRFDDKILKRPWSAVLWKDPEAGEHPKPNFNYDLTHMKQQRTPKTPVMLGGRVFFNG